MVWLNNWLKTVNYQCQKVYIIPTDVPNAFATGRNPEHAAVAGNSRNFNVLLTDDELAGVLGHELTHCLKIVIP